MKHSQFSSCGLTVLAIAVIVAGCGYGGGTTDLHPSAAGRTSPEVIVRGVRCILPYQTTRRFGRRVLVRYGECANGGFFPMPASWSSSGGQLHVDGNEEKARFSAWTPGVYTVTADSLQSTIDVRQ
jgi:hypothetical protein